MKSTVLSCFLAFTMLMLTGCPRTGQIRGPELADIQLGMSKQDVIERLGKPINASANEKFAVYRYFQDRGRYRIFYHEFIFVEGKLKLFGQTDTPDFKAKLEVITTQKDNQ